MNRFSSSAWKHLCKLSSNYFHPRKVISCPLFLCSPPTQKKKKLLVEKAQCPSQPKHKSYKTVWWKISAHLNNQALPRSKWSIAKPTMKTKQSFTGRYLGCLAPWSRFSLHCRPWRGKEKGKLYKIFNQTI